MMTMELKRLREEYDIEDVNPLKMYRQTLSSVSKLKHQRTAMEFDKILNDQGIMEKQIDLDQPKRFSEEMIKGRFYGPPTPLQTDYSFEQLNRTNVFMLQFYTSTLIFYNRLVCILESIIHESSSTHHSSDFIRLSQKHILLKSKASNTMNILDELLTGKPHMSNSIESFYADYIGKFTGKTGLQEQCWKWLVRNSKLINAVMKRSSLVEVVEGLANYDPGRQIMTQTSE